MADRLKEVRLRPRTESHDLDVKLKSIRRFLEEGDRVRLTVLYRGREVIHPHIGEGLLQRIVGLCEDLGRCQGGPVREGKRTHVTVVPRKRG